MEMQIFELNRLTSRLTMTDTLENFTIEVKQFVTEKLCENYHSVEPYFYMRKLYILQNNLQETKKR